MFTLESNFYFTFLSKSGSIDPGMWRSLQRHIRSGFLVYGFTRSYENRGV